MDSEFESLANERTLVVLWSAKWNEKWPGAGLEHLIVRAGFAHGAIIGVDESDDVFRIEYRVGWDERWRTREAVIEVLGSSRSAEFSLTSDGDGRWFGSESEELSNLGGCLDVDIWPTPFTNTLAIRRLQLGVGERREFDVVYVDALAGTIVKARQAYTRESTGRAFKFESVGSDFSALLDVDAFGLVTEYPGFFSRVWPQDTASAQ